MSLHEKPKIEDFQKYLSVVFLKIFNNIKTRFLFSVFDTQIDTRLSYKV